MVPNKICRSQISAMRVASLIIIANQDFMGEFRGPRTSRPGAMLRGISDQAQHRNRLGSTGCAAGRVPG